MLEMTMQLRADASREDAPDNEFTPARGCCHENTCSNVTSRAYATCISFIHEFAPIAFVRCLNNTRA